MSEYLWMLEPGDEWAETRLKWNDSLKAQGSSNYFLPEPQRSSSLTRAYQFGDPIRAIDWRAYARKEEWIVRLEKPESRVTANYFIDLSESMFYPDQSHPEWDLEKPDIYCSKALLALKLAFYSAYVYARMNNPIKIIFFSNQTSKLVSGNDEIDLLLFSSNRSSEILEMYQEVKASVFRKNFEEAAKSFSKLGFVRTKFKDALSAVEEIFNSSSSLDFVISDDLGDDDFMKNIFMRSRRSVFYHCLHQTEMEDSWINKTQAFKPSQLYASFFKGSEFLKDKVLAKSRNIWLQTSQRKYSFEQNFYKYQLVHESLPTSSLLGDLERLDD